MKIILNSVVERMVPISLLSGYFCIGVASALPSLGATYVMVDVLNFDASDIANVAILCSVPWCLKPLIAALSDKTTCFCGYRRRPYVSFFSLLCGLIMLLTPQFATRAEDATSFVKCLAVTSLCVCVVDVCLDGSLMVLVSEEKKTGTEGVAQGHAWAARVAGATIGAGWGGKVYTFSFTTLMILSSILPLMMTVVAFDIPDINVKKAKKKSLDERVTEYNSKYKCSVIRTTLNSLWECRHVLAATILVTIVPEFNTSLFFYMIGGGMEPQALSMVEVAGSMASLGALLIYNATRPSHRLSFGFGILLNTTAALVGTLMANDSVPWLLEAAAVEAIIASTASILCLMPTITVLGSFASKTKAESTVYSTGLSIMNLSGVVSEAIASRSMASFNINKQDVNSVRVFVGAVAVLSLTTLPVALCFPSRSKKETPGVLGYAHPGLRRKKPKKKLKEVFTLETSDSSGEDITKTEEGETKALHSCVAGSDEKSSDVAKSV